MVSLPSNVLLSTPTNPLTIAKTEVLSLTLSAWIEHDINSNNNNQTTTAEKVRTGLSQKKEGQLELFSGVIYVYLCLLYLFFLLVAWHWKTGL